MNINHLLLTGTQFSPWAPVLHHTPEVASGISAATRLEFGRYWDTPMSEMDPGSLTENILRYAPGMVDQLREMMTA
jgi:hypothetical protein